MLRRHSPIALTGAVLLATVLPALPLAAQDTTRIRGIEVAARPSVRALRLDPEAAESIRLDGRLDEAVWATAPVASGFRQREPREGAPASQDTEVRVLFDAATLYIGVLARDSEPDRIIARILQRDHVLDDGHGIEWAGDDAIAILLDPFHDRRNGVVFATNPNGAEFDALLTDENDLNVDWRGVWQVRAARVPEGWSAEFAIPFRTLRYPAGGSGTWGFNVARIIRRSNEETLWSAWSRDNEGFHRVSRAGTLEGMTDLPRPGLNLEVKPFALGGAAGVADTTGRLRLDREIDVGLDAKYEVRPGLLLDLTLNTDFAQVEADDQQINLTRFSLFFPEKRDFFLENAGIFEFGGGGFGPGGTPFLLFFSRRIGIADQGQVPVLGGARLTGRVGKQTIGFLDVATDDAFGQPRTNFAVARIKRDAGRSGYIGALLTDRRGGDAAGTAGGIDWSLWPTKRLNFLGYAAATGASGASGDGVAYRVALDYTADRWGYLVAHSGISKDVTAPIGYVQRTDMRSSSAYGRHTLRPGVLGLRLIDLTASVGYVAAWDGGLHEWEARPELRFRWESGESAEVEYTRGMVRLREGFRMADSVDIPAGDHEFREVGFSVGTSEARAVGFEIGASRGEAYGGTMTGAGAELRLAPGSHLLLHLGYERDDVDLPGGGFTAHLGSLRATVAFTTRLAANALVQYNSLDESLSANVRLSYMHAPGRDLYIVFNEGRGANGSLAEIGRAHV